MGARGHQRAVLLALRLAFGAVHHDDRIAMRAFRDCPPLGRGGEACPAAPDDVRALDGIDQLSSNPRQRSRRVERLEERGHCGSLRSTAALNVVRAAASGSPAGEVSLQKTAMPTAATHAPVMASIQADQVSVPVPSPWMTPTGQAA